MASLTLLAIALCLAVLPAYGSWSQQRKDPYYGHKSGFPFGTGGTRQVPGGRGRTAQGRGGFRQGTNAGGRVPFGSQQRQAQVPTKKLPVPEKFANPQDAVAFHGIRATDQFFYKEGPVLFDYVITNLNGGYNPEYGVFTAPVPGVYIVNYHVTSKGKTSKAAHVDLLQNNKLVNSAKSFGDCVTASNSASLYLDQFDTLRVNGRMGSIIGCSITKSCTFSVTLVKMGKFTDQKIPRAFPMDKW